MVRDLRGAVTGRTVVEVDLRRPDVVRFPAPDAFVGGLRDRTIDAAGRRGKFIHLALGPAGGAVPDAAEDVLVVHLGMTGHLDVCDARSAFRPHTHVRCVLDDGRELRFADSRRFGRVLLGPLPVLEAARVLPRLGVEPLSDGFTAAVLDARLRRTTRAVKAVLLDQSVVAGIGNIYADEACFRAGIRPGRRAHRLTRAERERLRTALVAVLEAAIVNRGTTFDDFRDVWDAKGGHQERLQVYGRGGMPCLNCATPLRSAVLAGRTTVWCPACQR